jgi:UV DNA damage endonuclease
MRDQVVPPPLGPHADLVSPWDALELLRAATGPLDVMLEAKAKDVALLWLRRQLEVLDPEIAAAEERPAVVSPGGRGSPHRGA